MSKSKNVAPITNFGMVTEFNRVLGQGVAESASIPSLDTCTLRMSLIQEEAINEMGKALDSRDLVALADAIGDALVVVYGAANDAGLDADAIMKAVHKSNMSKLCIGEEDAKLSVERYLAGDGFHGKHEPVPAAYRPSEVPGAFIVYNQQTGKTLKGIGFVEPTEELEAIVYPNGRPVDLHVALREQARAKVQAGTMTPRDLWLFESTLDNLNAAE